VGEQRPDSPGPRAQGVIEVEQDDAPPPIPPAELPREAIARLIDEGNIQSVESALREQNVRLPVVLEELERVLQLGLGNLAAHLVTMLVSSFHISRADRLAEGVLEHQATAGDDELIDMAAALMTQERLTIATRVIEAVLSRDPLHGRALYLKARILARRGLAGEAFDLIARVSPKLLGPMGLVVQARYAVLGKRGDKAIEGALKLARKADDDETAQPIAEVERIRRRMGQAPKELLDRAASDLRTVMALEYGSLLVELAHDARDGGRFGMDPIAVRDVDRTLDRMLRVISAAGLEVKELLFATEDGEVVAEALARRTGAPSKPWRADRSPQVGAWLCMASASTHPHLPHSAVESLQVALDEGWLMTLALVLPCGWRGPLVPDVVGRITGDDELPWAIDDEIAEVIERMKDEDEELTASLVRDDEEEMLAHAKRARSLLRASQATPRPGHVPFFDETPIPRA
jgi:hypothetical protein